jgi:hypothetical protein
VGGNVDGGARRRVGGGSSRGGLSTALAAAAPAAAARPRNSTGGTFMQSSSMTTMVNPSSRHERGAGAQVGARHSAGATTLALAAAGDVAKLSPLTRTISLAGGAAGAGGGDVAIATSPSSTHAAKRTKGPGGGTPSRR